MKILKTKSFALLIVLLPMLYACPKTGVKAPVADTELESSVDAVFATFLVSDIEMMCGEIAQTNYQPKFYKPQPGEIETQFNAYNPTGQNSYIAAYTYPTKCYDGRTRKGSVFLDYSNTQLNANYYQNYKFQGKLTLSDYRVDGWLINTVDGIPCEITNELSSPTFDPQKTNLSWKIKGSFEFTHPTDPTKNMVWTGELIKTLSNTANSDVYNSALISPIDWSKAIVKYTGKATGVTSGNVPFELTINDYFPLTRDFTCYPNVVGGIESVQPLRTWKNESHPFISGKLNFVTDDKYPREIYLGNEGTPAGIAQCDNKGIVLIKGNSYAVDFK